MSAIEPTLRELRRQRARAEIAATAVALFHEQGYDATTVDQIATAALVSPRTFYNYFPSKEDVLFYEVDAGTDAFRTQVLVDAATGGPFDAVRAACLAVADHLDARAEVERPRLELIASVPALQARDRRADSALVDAIATALGADAESDPAYRHARFVAGATVGALNEAIALWIAGGGHTTLRQLVDDLFTALRPLYPE